MSWLDRFSAVWSIDFEFSQPPGERPSVGCLVAREYHSKRIVRIGREELTNMSRPPFEMGDDVLFVAYYSSAEWSCFLALGWELPTRILDLWVEFRALLNGSRPSTGWGLLSCLAYHGLDSMAATEKQEMRELAIRGGPFTDSEMIALLDYCQSDVDALDRLLPIMTPKLDVPRALLRGRYMAAVARVESLGVPIDMEMLSSFRANWETIKEELIATVDVDFGVYEDKTFKLDRFASYLARHQISWPCTPSGRLALDDDTFRAQAKIHSQLSPLRELRHTLSEMKLERLAVGRDGRNRVMLRPFASRSGRNQPSNNQFIFGPSVWLRGLIKPQPGRAIAYVDWSQQELGIAAALSGDAALARAYESGDPYLEFAKMAGAVPATATKISHPKERSVFKECMLAVNYGMQAESLAVRLAQPTAYARNLLRLHSETFPRFWEWTQQQVDTAMLTGKMQTMFGWPIHTIGGDNPRALANFPCQGNGAEMMRLACSMATEAGIAVCCPVHDALLVEADIDQIDAVVAQTQEIMQEASRIVLAGFSLESDAKIICYPDRYVDEDRGLHMWRKVVALVHKASREAHEIVIKGA